MMLLIYIKMMLFITFRLFFSFFFFSFLFFSFLFFSFLFFSFLFFFFFFMIFLQSFLNVADNSGAKTVKCIGLLSGRKYASVGDCIIVSVRSLRHGSSSIRKGHIFKALILRTKKSLLPRKSGHSLSFFSNDVALINSQGNFVGSRVFGPVTRELRSQSFVSLQVLSRRIF